MLLLGHGGQGIGAVCLGDRHSGGPPGRPHARGRLRPRRRGLPGLREADDGNDHRDRSIAQDDRDGHAQEPRARRRGPGCARGHRAGGRGPRRSALRQGSGPAPRPPRARRRSPPPRRPAPARRRAGRRATAPRAARPARRSPSPGRRAAPRRPRRAPPPRARRRPCDRTCGRAGPPRARSPAGPHGIALLEERAHALVHVLGRERERELRLQEGQRVGERHVLLAEHRVLAQPHQHR